MTTIALYRDLLAEHAAAAGVEVWAWVLMPNHVHLILVPHDSDALRRALAPVHRYYAGHVHTRQKRSGHFWQGRFGCVAMDENHLGAALRYVALNPVRARLVQASDRLALVQRPCASGAQGWTDRTRTGAFALSRFRGVDQIG